ncbi:cell division protein ZapD [Nitrosospira sp. Nl5]|uniref:cell division protein ZapD n=1 Tax=Nitrosospira sp. Nl5 TaxID=200120 RepID=UPI000883FE43|nr:cell division protein ZapD [Nitrosospira sp. Nl5]SCY63726.1 cell division protein ZapD [Nitrosospira sp. Nl5]
MICYEHPLSERIRTLLRLEDLFDKMAFFSAKDEATEHHCALVTLFEILDVTGRADMKSDLLQELERQKQALEILRRNPDVSEGALNQVLDNMQAASHNMLNMTGKIGEHVRENEWLMSIKQRIGIPGGVCEFDLPSYHYWLHLDPALRRNDLNEWLAPLLPLQDGFSIVLHLLRNSGKTLRHTAHRGVYQQMGSGRVAHMLCLKVKESLPCVPEISANKYALNIRFVISGSRQKTRIYEDDVEFELTFCNL